MFALQIKLFARLLISLFEHLHVRIFVFTESRVLHSKENLQTGGRHDYKPERKRHEGMVRDMKPIMRGSKHLLSSLRLQRLGNTPVGLQN